MADTQQFSITVQQESDFVFRIAFEDTEIPDLFTDEPPPLGGNTGPNPSRMLLAAVANCLSASLLFALRKFKNTPGTLNSRATATLGRNDEGRLRVDHIDVTLHLSGNAGDYLQLERVLAQFEDFCVVTESVRAGVQVSVRVEDSQGTSLHATTQE